MRNLFAGETTPAWIAGPGSTRKKGDGAMTTLMERMPMTGMGTSAMPGMGMGSPIGMSAGPSMMMTPRCSMKFEKCAGGMKMTCNCDDKVGCSMMQNLCNMLAGGMCSCCMMLNGMVVCCCNLTMGLCKCEMTDKGVCITCTSGDAQCGAMIQSCCDCMAAMLKAGCTCCLMMNNTPICCGC